MFKIYDGRDYFYQWDLNRKLIIEDSTVKQVHFCNRTEECSLVVETYEQDGSLVADVPNILLQTSWRVRAYAYDGNATLHEQWYEVKARTKPEDYIYTETELKSWEELEERVNQIEENGVSDEKIESAVNAYLTENPVEVDLTGYATEKYVDEAISAIPEVDLSDYAKKSDIPSTAGLATESYVQEEISKIEIPSTDLTDYATKDYVAQEIAEAQLGGSGGEVNLDNYYTKAEVDNAINTIELTPGPQGPKGEDGYTPVKGVDYFDGKDGEPGAPGKDGADSTVPGPQGPAGNDGYTPVKGTDYWTDADKAAMVNDVIAALPVYDGSVR